MKNDNFLQKLITKAEIDLKTIENLLKFEDSPPESICFHAEQAIEKYLKAYLQFLGIIYRPTHDLDYLIELIVQKDKDFEVFFEIADELTLFAVCIRYENDTGDYSISDAINAQKKALEIKELILTKIKKKS